MAKRRKFKCSKCDRRFSMAAHLARHLNTMHASKKAKAAQKKKRRAVATKKPASVATRAGRGARSDLGDVLGSLNAYRDQLADQSNEIDNQVQAIDAALMALGAGAAKPVVARRKRGGKGARAGTLKGTTTVSTPVPEAAGARLARFSSRTSGFTAESAVPAGIERPHAVE